jgi:hypothetical protein
VHEVDISLSCLKRDEWNERLKTFLLLECRVKKVQETKA